MPEQPQKQAQRIHLPALRYDVTGATQETAKGWGSRFTVFFELPA